MTEGTAIVLAGGTSSRMGRPKALLRFEGAPLVAHVVRILRAAFAETIVVAAPGRELPDLPAAVVRDEVPHRGPVGGLVYGLRAAGRELCFVSSCDAPFLSAPLASHLVSRLVDCDVAVPRWGDRFQPLHAAYRRSVLPRLERQLERGESRMIDLFDQVRTCTIEPEEVRRFDPEGWSFFNVNTPEDYERALRRAAELRGGRPGA